MSTKKGLFITFEGGEGAGKTTQIGLLRDYLVSKGHAPVLTREPGGTAEAEKIRALLVRREGGSWTAEAETCLFFAARHMHYTYLIAPALSEGKIVLCDRFTDSTRAYQSYGHNLSLDFINDMNALVMQGVEPDLTFILDIPPDKGLERSLTRLERESRSASPALREGAAVADVSARKSVIGRPSSVGDKSTLQGGSAEREDRFERMGREFHENLRRGFLEIGKKDPDRCKIIDASGSEQKVHTKIKEYLHDGYV